MAEFIDEFMQSYAPEVTRQLSTSFKVDQNTAQKLIPTLASLILSGLKAQKDTLGGNGLLGSILGGFTFCD